MIDAQIVYSDLEGGAHGYLGLALSQDAALFLAAKIA